MADIGSQLRTAREARGLTLEQAYKLTRIKAVYLEALEANRVNALPGIVQARGFLRTYANFLGLDGEALASALDAEKVVVPEVSAATAVRPIVSTPPKSIASVPSKPLAPSPDRSLPPARPIEPLRLPKLSFDISRDTSSASPGGIPTTWLIVGAIVLFVVGVILVISALSGGGARPLPTPDMNLPMSIKPVEAIEPPASAMTSNDPVSITVSVDEHVWVRITVDGQTAFEGLMQPGTSQTWEAKDQIIVETGNAAGVNVTHAGQSSALGNRGQILARAWGHSGSENVPVAASAGMTRTGLQPQAISTTLKP